MNTPRNTPFRRNRRRGSILLTVMIFSLLIMAALGTYLGLGLNAMRTANRALNNYAAFNLAEAGIEEGLLALNTADWTDWRFDGPDAMRLIQGITPTQNLRYDIQVVVYNYASTTSPRILAQGSTYIRNEPPLVKQIEVKLLRRSRFANTLVGRDWVKFNGNNPTVDSWHSDPDHDGVHTPYSAAAGVRRDNGSAGSVSVEMDAVCIGNADIWGKAATGGSMPNVGPNGKIRSFAGVGNPSPSNPEVDLDRIATDFSANLDPVTEPTSYKIYTDGGGSISSSVTLPLSGDAANTTYLINSISLTNKTLTIAANSNVSVIVTGDIKTGGGSGQITISDGASLTIYARGNVAIAGNGVVNGAAVGAGTHPTKPPETLQIYGTAASSQSIDYTGNAKFNGVIYAPNAAIKLAGNAESYGAFVGANITVSGNGTVHYDEALADLGGDKLGIAKWRELVDDRIDITSFFSY